MFLQIQSYERIVQSNLFLASLQLFGLSITSQVLIKDHTTEQTSTYSRPLQLTFPEHNNWEFVPHPWRIACGFVKRPRNVINKDSEMGPVLYCSYIRRLI